MRNRKPSVGGASVKEVHEGSKNFFAKLAKEHLNFYRLHLLFFIIIPLISSGIFHASNGENKLAFIDCLFMCYSAMTACGLATVLFADVTKSQAVLLLLLIALGSVSSVSIIVILVRRHFFRKKFHHLLVHSPALRERVSALARTGSDSKAEKAGSKPSSLRRQVRCPPVNKQGQARHAPNNLALTRTRSFAPDSGVPAIREDLGGFPNPFIIAIKFIASRISIVRQAFEAPEEPFPCTSTLVSTRSGTQAEQWNDPHRLKESVSYISFNTEVGRNSKFLRLNAEQQEELGGVEYRALSLLLKIIIGYWLGLQLIGVATIAPWLTYSKTYQPVFEPEDAKRINPTFFSFFLLFSAFGNNGMSIVDDSMVPFQKAYWLLLVTGFLVLAGNTALPVFLRLTIWTGSKLVPRESRTRETLQFLLDHPRRCYIYLFPSHQTWFLVFLLVLFNGLDWICFWLLDIGNPVLEALSPGERAIDGLFQALAVRTAGFAIVNLGQVTPALQFLFAIMMYISAYPIAISIRSTNTYEDQAVGVQEDEVDEAELEAQFHRGARPPSDYILSHVRRQLSFDIGFVVFAVFLLCVMERHRIGSSDWSEVTVFSLIFETLSAYGCVGLSLGNNTNSSSLSGVLRTLSKLVLIATMVRGRHRGLPVRIDRSIMLPSELEGAEEPAPEDEYDGE
ncbi:hypothetical protein JCM5353_001457 [Sporobolomyces roseus]